MSQVQETGKAPTNERPSQVNSTTSRPSSLEAAVFECLCAGLTNAGVPHGVIARVGDRHLSKDQADRIATAIVAEFGGTIERRLYGAKPGAHPAFGNLKVTLRDDDSGCVEVNIFYDMREEV